MKTSIHFQSRAAGLALAAILGSLAGCGDSRDSSEPVVAANAFASEQAARQPPAIQANTMATVQLAVHDALNAITPRFEPYAYRGASPEASVDAAVAAATHEVLARLVPEARTAIDERHAAVLASQPDGAAKDAGIAVGQAAARAILDARSDQDIGAAVGAPFAPFAPGPAGPGVYQPTPPAGIVIGAGLGAVRPFALPSPAMVRSAAPHDVSSPAYAVEYGDVRALGTVDSSSRSEAQTETARFWFDVIAAEWHDAARQVLVARGADAWLAARTLAQLGVAMFDGVVASFETKFAFGFWRPITAIRAGADDGNADTVGDPLWEPLCPTPPFPEHNSTHAVTGAAAAAVLGAALGDDATFTIRSPTLTGLSRTYHRFSAAAEEEGLSRIYCGIHFRRAVDEGLVQGRRVGEAVRSLLPPVRASGVAP